MMLRALIIIGLLSFIGGHLTAGTGVHQIDPISGTQVTVDDSGGFEGEFEFLLVGIGQTSGGIIMVWDGNVSHSHKTTGFITTSAPFGVVDAGGQFGLVEQVSYGNTPPFGEAVYESTPIRVYQKTYSRDQRYVIYRLTIENISNQVITKPKVMMSIDWDLLNRNDDGWPDLDSAFIANELMVYQQDGPANSDNSNHTGAIALIHGKFDNYNLGECCALSNNEQNSHAEYFMGNPTWTGDVDGFSPGEVGDREIGISATLPALAPGESACVAFAQLMDTGVTSADALNGLMGELTRARKMWESIPDKGACFTINAGQNGNWWNGPGRNGEGAQIEISQASDGSQTFVATFYSYDPNGKQIFLIAVGTVVGNRVDVDVYITDGGIWGPNFDPALVSESQWGTGVFTANDCARVQMELTPNAQYQALGYTTLTYDLSRLTTPLVPCPFTN